MKRNTSINGWSLSVNDDGSVAAVDTECRVGGDIAIKAAGRLEQRLLHQLVTDLVQQNVQPTPKRARKKKFSVSAAALNPMDTFPRTTKPVLAFYADGVYGKKGQCTMLTTNGQCWYFASAYVNAHARDFIGWIAVDLVE